MSEKTAKARLRDAAIELVVDGGAKAVTARAVADKAGLSLGLIRHHYGSMADLLDACDRYIAERIRVNKRQGIQQGSGFDALAAVRETGERHIMGYLAMRLGDDTPAVNALVDELIDDAEGYIGAAIQAGMMTPSRDLRAQAVMLTLFSLGTLSLHRHLKRQLDVDVRATELAAEPGFARYVLSQMETFASLFTPEVFAQYATVFENLRHDEEKEE